MTNYKVSKIEETSAGVSIAFIKENDMDFKQNILVPSKFWKENRCHVGEVITQDTFEKFNKVAVFNMAISRTIKILSYSPHSKSMLEKKLASYGFDKETCQEASNYAVKKSYINESEQAIATANYYLKNKNWGKKRIAADLLMKGYPKAIVINATTSINEEEYLSTLKKLIKKKHFSPDMSYEEKATICASLARMGYSKSEIEIVEKDLIQDE